MNYEFEFGVECPVDKSFAWAFRSDVANWAAVDSSVVPGESATIVITLKIL